MRKIYKSSSVELKVLFIVIWIRTMKHHETGLADPPLDPRSFSDSRNMKCDISWEAELNFLSSYNH